MKSFTIYLIFLVITFTDIEAQWTRTNGPEGVAVSTLAYVDGNIYSGTKVNGVYISTDDGLTWVARNTGIETLEVTSIVYKQGYVFAGTFGGGVFRSTDGGQTWLAPSNGTNFAVTSMVIDDEYIFAGTVSNGGQRSSDNGVTWTEKLSGLFGVGAICKSGNKVIASTSNYTLESTDHGETWSYITALDGAIIFSYYTMGDTIFAGGQTKIYRSLDNGNNFTTINLNLGFSIVNISAFTYVNSTLYAATSYDGVYKSTDFGSTWIPSNQGIGPKDVRALTSTDASYLIAGTHYVGMYRSTDFGESWNKSQTGFPAGTSILCILESENSLYAGTRDGVFRTDDNGDTWTKMGGTNDTTMYSDIWAMCEHNGVLYASMQLYFDATVYKSTDKGSTWTRCGMTGLPFGLSFIKGLESSGNNIVAGTDEGVYYSSDGGDSWNPTNVPIINIPSLASSGDYVYATTTSIASVYRSANNGINWTVSLQSSFDFIEVAAMNNYAYAGTFFGGARYTSNFGSTWFECNGFPSDASIFELYPVSDGMVLAGTDLSPNWIYVSNDYGNYFIPYSEGLFENASVEAFAVNETYMFAGTDYNGVWRRYLPGIPVELIAFTATSDENTIILNWETATETNNSGFEILRLIQNENSEWEQIGFVEGNGTTSEPKQYIFIDEKVKTGKYSYRLKQIDFNGIFQYSNVIEIEIEMISGEFIISQNYPNPFNPSTKIKYEIAGQSMVNLTVYNLLGQQVAILVNQELSAGVYEVDFNAADLPDRQAGLPSGVYMYRIQAVPGGRQAGDPSTGSVQGFVQSKKMILLK